MTNPSALTAWALKHGLITAPKTVPTPALAEPIIAVPQPLPQLETAPVSIEDTVKSDLAAFATAIDAAAPKLKALIDNAVAAARADEQKIASDAKVIADQAASDAKAAYDATITALQTEVAALKSKWAAFEASLTPADGDS